MPFWCSFVLGAQLSASCTKSPESILWTEDNIRLFMLHSATQQLVPSAASLAQTSRCNHRRYAGRRTLEVFTNARTLR